LRDFPALSFFGIAFSAEAKESPSLDFRHVAECQNECNRVPVEEKTSLVLRPECNVHVRVLCVEVRCGHPLKAGFRGLLHARKELPRLVVEIESLAELLARQLF